MKKYFSLLIIVIFFLQQAVAQTNISSFTIGVIDTDYILENYVFAIQARNTLGKKADEATNLLKTKTMELQNESAEFQRKLENNVFISRESAEQEMQRIKKKGDDLEKYQENTQRDLMQEQEILAQQLKDRIILAIKEINKDKRFSIVLSTSSLNDNVFYVEPQYDITKEILEILNKHYK